MASQVQKLIQTTDAVKALLEDVRGDSMTAEHRIKTGKVGIIGPIEGTHAADEILAYINGAEKSAADVRAKLQAAINRAERLTQQARGI